METGALCLRAGVSLAAIDSHMVGGAVAILVVNTVNSFTGNGNRFFAAGRRVTVTVSSGSNKAVTFCLAGVVGTGTSDQDITTGAKIVFVIGATMSITG